MKPSSKMREAGGCSIELKMNLCQFIKVEIVYNGYKGKI